MNSNEVVEKAEQVLNNLEWLAKSTEEARAKLAKILKTKENTNISAAVNDNMNSILQMYERVAVAYTDLCELEDKT